MITKQRLLQENRWYPRHVKARSQRFQKQGNQGKYYINQGKYRKQNTPPNSNNTIQSSLSRHSGVLLAHRATYATTDRALRETCRPGGCSMGAHMQALRSQHGTTQASLVIAVHGNTCRSGCFQHEGHTCRCGGCSTRPHVQVWRLQYRATRAGLLTGQDLHCKVD